MTESKQKRDLDLFIQLDRNHNFYPYFVHKKMEDIGSFLSTSRTIASGDYKQHHIKIWLDRCEHMYVMTRIGSTTYISVDFGDICIESVIEHGKRKLTLYLKTDTTDVKKIPNDSFIQNYEKISTIYTFHFFNSSKKSFCL